MAIHVDDLLKSTSNELNQIIMKQLKEKFKLSKEVEIEFLHTGLEIKQKSNCIERYIGDINKICIDQGRLHDNKLSDNDVEYEQLHSLCGQLLWVSTQTRPDMAYYTCCE